MSVKNCTNCFWNYNSICENTNWKSGDKIDNSKEPACGYMMKTSTTPVSWKLTTKENHEHFYNSNKTTT